METAIGLGLLLGRRVGGDRLIVLEGLDRFLEGLDRILLRLAFLLDQRKLMAILVLLLLLLLLMGREVHVTTLDELERVG